jgi:hypothetical protein
MVPDFLNNRCAPYGQEGDKMPPKIRIPDYSHIEKRGQLIGSMIENLAATTGQTIQAATQQYQQKRSKDTAYKGVRGMILDEQEAYGLSDSQAEALVSKLKYRPDETISAYEKRISPTLTNMRLYKDRSESLDYKVDMPDPFLDTQSFSAMIDENYRSRVQKETGAVVQDVTTMDKPKTREEATEIIAGRMGGRAVTDQQLEQYPGYRGLPTQKELDAQTAADVAGRRAAAQEGRAIAQEGRREEMHAADLKYKEAQTKAADALTQQRKTSAKVKELAGKGKKGVNELDDLETITKMEIAARELLKDIDRNDEATGDIREEWIEMKEFADLLKEKRNEIAKASQKPKPSMEAMSVGEKIGEDVSKMFDLENPTEAGKKGARELTAQKLNQYAMSNGVNINYDKIRQALKQGKSAAEVAEIILYIKNNQKSKQVKPTGIPVTGGRFGR